jgi:hypothetical protein
MTADISWAHLRVSWGWQLTEPVHRERILMPMLASALPSSALEREVRL